MPAPSARPDAGVPRASRGGHAPPASPGPSRRPLARGLPACLAMLVIASAGCEREVDTTYAAVRGDSINGIAAFVQLLRDTGHAVTARQTLPGDFAAEMTTLVVFDDSFTGLDPAATELLVEFVVAASDRTLLLVLRDSDCVVDYLRAVLADDALPADRRLRAERLLERFETTLAFETAEPRAASEPFADGLDVTRRGDGVEAIDVTVQPRSGAARRVIPARWELRRRLKTTPGGTTLWAAGPEPLFTSQPIGTATVLVLASAAPILNGGLVDPGNRLLAEDLAARLPTEGKLLVAGSARRASGGGDGDGGGGGAGDDRGEDEPSPWRLLTVEPLPWVAAQVIAAMALFCWCTAPIFGRPRQTSPTHAQDFGHHVAALANLFDKSAAAGATFARQRLADWREAAPHPTAKPRRPIRP